MPSVSIIIPIFNASAFLARCVESCLSQTTGDIEIILVEDKSTDSSLQIARSFLGDKRVKLIANAHNLGTFLSRNLGVNAASGEYIVFLDADDYLREDAVESLLKIAKDYDIIHFGITHSPRLPHATMPRIYTNELCGDSIIKTIFLDNFKQSWFIVCSRMFRASVVKDAVSKLGFIKRHLIASEDTILFFVICLLARKSIGTSEAFYIYCHNESSIMRTKDSARLQKQIDDRSYLIEAFNALENDEGLRAHRHFRRAKDNMINLLSYFICFSKRFQAENSPIPPYLKYSLQSFRYMPRWQIAVKTLIYLLTFGRRKL